MRILYTWNPQKKTPRYRNLHNFYHFLRRGNFEGIEGIEDFWGFLRILRFFEDFWGSKGVFLRVFEDIAIVPWWKINQKSVKMTDSSQTNIELNIYINKRVELGLSVHKSLGFTIQIHENHKRSVRTNRSFKTTDLIHKSHDSVFTCEFDQLFWRRRNSFIENRQELQNRESRSPDPWNQRFYSQQFRKNYISIR